jgi:methionyl-tRNA formyltransferase
MSGHSSAERPALRVAFAGTPEFAAVALAAIGAAGFEVPLVLSQPDRPAGRGMKLLPSAVKALAVSRGLPVAQPQGLRLDGKYAADAAAAREALLAARPDVMVVAAYGLILPQWALDLPCLGCLNIHGSLLPRWRGAAPIHRAIEAGDAETGITLMQMDVGLDTGDMLAVERVAIGDVDTTASLHDALAALGGRMVVDGLLALQAGAVVRTPQPAEGVSYAHKIEKAEAAVDWRQCAVQIGRRVRAFNPFPAASSGLRGETVKFWLATPEAIAHTAAPGQVLSADAAGVRVACGEGVLRITELQRPGGKRLSAAQFLQSCPDVVGARFESAGATA